MTVVLQHVIDAVSLGSLYALAALGVGLIFGVMRLINFAHGDFIMVGAYALIVPSTAIVATPLIGAWPALAMVAAILAIVVLLALATERIVFRPLRNADPATLLIGSFAVSFFLQHMVLIIYGGRPKAIDILSGLNEQVIVLGLRIPKLEIATIGITFVLLSGLALFLKRTMFGLQIRAAAEDFDMARLLGVRANTVIAMAFAASGFLAGVVALLLTTQSGVLYFGMGVQPVLFAFVATVIGGMGSLLGAALGGFLVGTVSVALQVLLPFELRLNRDAFVFLAVILVLLFRPGGLLQSRAAKERV
jgi:branched-chain amino acid transport system permease protein